MQQIVDPDCERRQTQIDGDEPRGLCGRQAHVVHVWPQRDAPANHCRVALAPRLFVLRLQQTTLEFQTFSRCELELKLTLYNSFPVSEAGREHI